MKATWRKAVVLMAALAVVGLTLSLGRWQLDRAEHKRAVQLKMAAQAVQPALGSQVLPCSAQDWTAQGLRRVNLQGRWLSQYTVLLENRPMAGQTGFVVLTPLRLEPAGSCAVQVVLVQRGWLPRNRHDRRLLPHYPTPGGLVTVPGHLIDTPSRTFSLAAEAPLFQGEGPWIAQNVEVSAWAAPIGQVLGLVLAPGVVLQTAPEQTQEQEAHAAQDDLAPDAVQRPLSRAWPVAASDIDKHHGYAVQWFALAALTAGLYVWFQLIRPYRQRSR